MTVAPYFENYLEALATLPVDTAAGGTFRRWHEAALQLLATIENRRNDNYAALLNFTQAYFSRGSLREGGGVDWFARTNKFNLSVVGDEAVINF